MIEALGRQLVLNGFLPHGYCLSWSAPLVGTYFVSDALIALAYFSMPIALGYFAWRRQDFPYKWLLWMFVAFILSCGTTHLMGTIILWRPLYWLDASLKAITAVASVATAIVLWPMIPKALKVPGNDQMRAVNAELHREIAERRRVEEELRRAHEELKRLHQAKEASLTTALLRLDAHMGNSPLGVVEFDPEFRITRWSDMAEHIFGWREEEIVGKPVLQLRWVHEDDADFLASTMASMLSGASSRNKVVHRNYRKDGSVIYCEWYNSAIYDDQGRLISVLSQVLDVTETRRKNEEIQRLNAELETRVRDRTAQLEHSNEALMHSNMELQRFAHAAAHDLQTPLRSIVGFTQILQEELRDCMDERARQLMDLVISNTKRLQTLIQELLAYSRLDAQARPFEPVAMEEVFGQVATTLAAPIGEAGAEVSCGELPTVTADRSQVTQLLQNLIENGIKYNRSTPPRVRVTCERQGNEWVFAVADNGIGIDPKHHERIFEIFRRLHAHHEIPGTGIGLAICYRIVERHGGRIWVESEVGRGSVFYFSLPA
ncbi:MAG TPA: ATP-binding protein [Rhodocyclaceae bacterium]|nr:ATP-binding protein [Rhodocyclaceae bacterium]